MAALQNERRNRIGYRIFLECGKQLLESLSLPRWESSLEKCELAPRNISLYLLFVFELLHNLHLEILKLFKECKTTYVSSDRLQNTTNKPESQEESPNYMQNPLFRACNSIIATIESEYYVSRLHVGFSKKAFDRQPNGLFVAGELREMLE